MAGTPPCNSATPPTSLPPPFTLGACQPTMPARLYALATPTYKRLPTARHLALTFWKPGTHTHTVLSFFQNIYILSTAFFRFFQNSPTIYKNRLGSPQLVPVTPTTSIPSFTPTFFLELCSLSFHDFPAIKAVCCLWLASTFLVLVSLYASLHSLSFS